MAQSTNYQNGSDYKFYHDTVEVAYLTGTSIDFSADNLDTSNKTEGKYKTNIAGAMGGTVSIEGFFRQDATEGYDQMFADMKAGNEIAGKISNDNAGDKEWAAQLNITSLSCSLPYNEVVTFSAEFTTTGEPTFTVIT